MKTKLIIFIFIFNCLNAAKIEPAPDNGKILKKIVPADVSYKTWDIYLNIDLNLFDDIAQILSAILEDLDYYCLDQCSPFILEYVRKIYEMTVQSKLPKLWLLQKTNFSENQFENGQNLDNIQINDENNYITIIKEEQSIYMKNIKALLNRLKEIHSQIQEIRNDSSILINFTEISSSVKLAFNEFESIHQNLENLITKPEEQDINEIIPFDLFQKEFNTLSKKIKNEDKLPFGMNKYNTLQFADTLIIVKNQTIFVKISIPITHNTIGRGYIYEIIPIPIRTNNGTGIIKNKSQYGIISDSFTPLTSREFVNCKATPAVNICKPASPTFKSNYCDFDIFLNKSRDEIFKNCEIESIKTKNYVTRINPLSYHFFIDSYFRYIEICPNLPNIDNNLSKDAIITIEKGCEIHSDHFYVNTESNYTHYYEQLKKEYNTKEALSKLILNETYLPILAFINDDKTPDESDNVQIVPSPDENKIDIRELFCITIFFSTIILITIYIKIYKKYCKPETFREAIPLRETMV